MVTKILTKFAVAKKKAEKNGIIYRSPRIYLPTKLTDDSSFPFLEGDEVTVRVERGRLVVEKDRDRGGVTIRRSMRATNRRRRKYGRPRNIHLRRVSRRQGLKRVSDATKSRRI